MTMLQVNWHQDIINCLLDNGSNVNQLNHEGVSSLAACHVHFYPVDKFKFNIAERYLEKPTDIEVEPGYDVNEALKGILSQASKRKTSPDRKVTQIDTKKIQNLREEYKTKSVQQPGEASDENNIVEGGESKTSLDSGLPVTNSETSVQEDGMYNGKKLGVLQIKRAQASPVPEDEESLTYRCVIIPDVVSLYWITGLASVFSLYLCHLCS